MKTSFRTYCLSFFHIPNYCILFYFTANGYKYVDFHIRGTRQFCRDELEELRNHLSILLCCPPKHIIIDGSQPENSLHLTFMVPEVCIEYLLMIKDDAKSRLHSYGVDRLRIDGQYIDCIGRNSYIFSGAC